MRTRYTTIAGVCALALTMTVRGQSRSDAMAGHIGHHIAPSSGAPRGGAPANDECDAAEALTVGVDCTTPTSGDNTNSTQSVEGPSCDNMTTGIYADVWYSFNSGANTSVDIDLVPSDTMTDNVLVVLDGCAGTEVLCYVLPPGPQSVEVTENTDYVIRVYSNTQYGDPGPFTICITATPPPPPVPANDDCANAIALTTGTDCAPTDGYTFGASESLPADSCNGYLGTADDDVWYSFVAGATEMTISVQGSAGFDAVVELFEGDCSTLTGIGCADGSVGGELEEIFQSGLVIGQSYLVRVFHYNDTETSPAAFTICATEGLSGIGMEEKGEGADNGLFPNPTDGPVTITWPGPAADVRFDVLEMTGRLAHSELRHMSPGQLATLSLGDLAAGTYSVRLTGGGARSSRRLMIR